MIAYIGLVEYNGDERDLAAQAEAAYRQYRRRFHTASGVERPLRWLRDRFVTALDKSRVVKVDRIQFLGLWDTVDAYGGPIEEITRAIDYWYWPLSMPDRFLNAKVHRACHALSLEDERDAFRPVIWDERYVRRDDHKLHDIDFGWSPEVLSMNSSRSTKSGSARSGLSGSTPTSEAATRRMDCPTPRSAG